MRSRWLSCVLLALLVDVVHAATLEIAITNIASANGSVWLAVYASADAWDGKAKPLHRVQRKSVKGQLDVAFTDVPPGTYAVSVIHDENDNGELDRYFFGMPKEGYGSSNDPKVRRRPTFAEAAFEVGEPETAIVIPMH